MLGVRAGGDGTGDLGSGLLTSPARKAFAVVVLGALIGPPAVPADAATARCLGRRATIVGTGGNNTITGTSRNDVIVAGAGRDVIDGRGGNDRICAQEGADFVYGSGGRDRVKAGGGNDYLAGGGGDDLLDGGGGFDYADYATSARGIKVVASADTVRGQGRDRIPRVEGIFGTSRADVMTGSDGSDDFFGDRGADTLSGLGGRDVIAGGRGVDTLDGGAGVVDIVLFFDASGGVTVDLGTNSVSGAESDSIAGFEGVAGSLRADTLRGTDAVNHLFGGYGDDELYGLGDADRLEGGGNDDFMSGDAGDDHLDGGAGNDGADGGDGTDACLRSETVVNCESFARLPQSRDDLMNPALAARWLREAARGGRSRALRR